MGQTVGLLMNTQFLLICTANLSLFLVLSTWSFLPLFIVEIGGDSADAGLVMGSMGVTSLGSLPFISPLIDRYGRKGFIIGGALLVGISNAGFLLFSSYSPLMVAVRLIQGVGFAACFNGCSTAVVDLVSPEQRDQGIGLFGASSSLAVAFGPYWGERILLWWGFDYYFLLLIGYGLIGTCAALLLREPERTVGLHEARGFFPTAIRDRYVSMMALAAAFGAGFAAMNVFLPLYAKTLGLHSGMFFVAYGLSLLVIRLFLGHLLDRIRRETLIWACLLVFGVMLWMTSKVYLVVHTILLGIVFGALQGIAYPAMMARMVDRSRDHNRGIVVGLFTGSFGAGLNASVLVWGWVAEMKGLPSMYLSAAAAMFLCGAVSLGVNLVRRNGGNRGTISRP